VSELGSRLLTGIVAIAIGGLVCVVAPASTLAREGDSIGEIVFASDLGRVAPLPAPALYSITTDGENRKRLTPYALGLAWPAWSPSASNLAFVRNGDLYLVRGARPGSRRLTRGAGIALPPVWSPDGAKIAYLGGGGRFLDLFVVDIRAERSRRLGRRVVGRQTLPYPGRPTWSPNGRRIAFVRAIREGIDRHQLRVVDVHTGREHRLTAPDGFDAEPSWAPDGTRISFTRYNRWGAFGLRVLDLRLRRLRHLAKGANAPAWSPDGTRIAFKRDYSIYVVDARGGRARVLSGRGFGGGSSFRDPPVWSPDGRRIAVVHRGEIYSVQVDGRRRQRVTREVPVRRLEGGFAWSHRGNRIAFISGAYDPGDLDLYTIAREGSALAVLTRNTLQEFDPAWSPDGKQVAFIRYRYPLVHPWPSVFSLVVMDLESGLVRSLAAGGHSPSWSPDGARIAFERNGDLFLVDAKGANEKLLRGTSEVETDPDWSPDGNRIAFASGPNNAVTGIHSSRKDIYAVELGSGVAVRVTSFEAERGERGCILRDAFEPAWSPDGKEIAYTLETGGSSSCLPSRGVYSSIRVVSADGQGSRFLTDGGHSSPIDDRGAYAPIWSPDGRQVLFVSDLEYRVGQEYRDIRRIGIVPREGGRFEFVTPRTFDAHSPDWRVSPLSATPPVR
jgi:Tol biopolymer transport system component